MDSPIQFEYEMIDYFINYDYDIQVDEDGNIDVYITHEPYRIDDSKVTINWDDANNKNNKRPDELTFELYNVDAKEQTITVSGSDNWTKEITNLYKNYAFGNPSEYSLKVSNTKDYEFNVTGNNTDGFVVNAKYIGKDINTSNTSFEDKDTINNQEITNPNTGDSITLVITLLVLSFLGTVFSFYKLKSIYYNK